MRVSKVLATVLLGFAVVEAANSDQSQGAQDSNEVSADNNGGGGNQNQKQAQGGNGNNQAGGNGNQQQGEGQQGEAQQGNAQKGQQGQGQGNQQGGKKGDGQQNQEQQNQKGGNQGNKNGGDNNNNGDNGQGAEQNATQGLQPLPGAPEAAASLQPLPGLASLPPGAQQSLKPLGGSQPPAPPASLQPLGGGVQANATAPPGSASSTIDLAQLTAIANSVNGGGAAAPAAAATPGSFANGTHPAAATPESGLKQLPAPAEASAPPAGTPAATPAMFMTIPGGMAGEGAAAVPMATATPPAEILPGAVPPPQAANLEPLPGSISSDASLMALAPQTMTTMTLTVAASDGSTVLATMTAPVNATAAASSGNATTTGGRGTVQVAGAPASRGSGTTGVVLVLSGVVGLLGYLMG